jgi:hypothetical protein
MMSVPKIEIGHVGQLVSVEITAAPAGTNFPVTDASGFLTTQLQN